MGREQIKEFLVPEGTRKLISNAEWLKQEFIKGKIPQQILGYGDATMDKFYAVACHLFQNKSYQEAVDTFFFLVVLNPYHYDYWLGLGAAIQRCEDYEGAIDAYEMAALCDLENPIPYFHLAKCLFAMHDRVNALQAIDLAIEYAEEQGGGEILQQARAAKALIVQEQE